MSEQSATPKMSTTTQRSAATQNSTTVPDSTTSHGSAASEGSLTPGASDLQLHRGGPGVTAPDGFRAAGVRAGLKKSGRDVCLVLNTGPQKTAAAVFTSNLFAAAPVLWSRQAVADGRADAIVVNSGGANACTGSAGFADTHHGAEFSAEELNTHFFASREDEVSAADVLVCSTGIIGERLDMPALKAGITEAAYTLDSTEASGNHAAEAILTTDTVTKTASVCVDGVTISGMAKGAGMLAPEMATMLCVITTDAAVDPSTLNSALNQAVAQTFNRVDSDGAMSTNDTVIAMASGASGVLPERFHEALTILCGDLAEQLIDDAEGAAHQITITTINAATEHDAEAASRAVARSNLFKTAIFGRDPNWGRILSAVGTTQVVCDPQRVDVAINGIWVCQDGGVGEDRSLVNLDNPQVEIIINLNAGDANATILTNDLTHDYVHENSAYSS